MSAELKAIQEEVVKLATDLQGEHKKLEEKGTETNQTLTKMEAEFVKLADKVQAAELTAKAEEKARQELELSMAKVFEEKGSEKAAGSAEYKKSFVDYAKKKTSINSDLVDQELKALIKDQTGLTLGDSEFIHVKTMLVGSNPDGGYLAPVEMSSKISKRIFETSPMRSLASVQTTANEALEIVLDDQEFDSGWIAELDSRTDTDTSKLGIITIPTHEQYAQPAATQKMLDDATFNVESFISGKVSEKFSRVENTSFVSGDAIKKPTGFLTYADWATAATYERDALETRETATASTVAGDDLIDLQTDLLEYYQASASWVMSRKTFGEILKLKDAVDGNYLMNPAMMFQGALGLQLLGKKVTLFSDMPAIGDGLMPIAYGDWGEGYLILDRMGIRILRDPYTEKGKIKYYTTKRVGGKVTNYQAIKRLKIKAAS